MHFMKMYSMNVASSKCFTRNLTTIFIKIWNGFNRPLKNLIHMETKWYPEDIYNVNTMKGKKYAVIVLNRKIKIPSLIVKDLWENATIRMTVDGGTNRWLTFIKKYCKNDKLKPPDLITGDFDSITQETLDYFKEVQRIHTPNQNETDFTKALMILKPIVEEQEIEKIVVIHDTSGRLDQIMANINTLFKSKKLFKNDNIEIYLISSNSLTWLLNPGQHSITIPLNLYENKRWCSLLPIGDKTIVTTIGLKWNLDNQKLQFGEIVSSSNTYSSQTVTISTSSFLLWSMGIFDDNDD